MIECIPNSRLWIALGPFWPAALIVFFCVFLALFLERDFVMMIEENSVIKNLCSADAASSLWENPYCLMIKQ